MRRTRNSRDAVEPVQDYPARDFVPSVLRPYEHGKVLYRVNERGDGLVVKRLRVPRPPGRSKRRSHVDNRKRAPDRDLDPQGHGGIVDERGELDSRALYGEDAINDPQGISAILGVVPELFPLDIDLCCHEQVEPPDDDQGGPELRKAISDYYKEQFGCRCGDKTPCNLPAQAPGE